MDDFEKLGVFYLGRAFDPETKTLSPAPLLYDSKDLVTHAVCVGMTGSGKTGLCIDLLEEAAIDGIPSIAIDPKGDLADILLTFPELREQDFAPWINPDEARNKGVTPEQYAAQQAEVWRKGLADWGQNGDRIRRLKEAADFVIYTPGSNAGIPVSILKSFEAPARQIVEDADLLRERISATVGGLLGLIGIEANPMQSREHILLSTILDLAWTSGTNLDLAAIIQQVQNPPVQKIGVFDLESFFPAKERFGFAMSINNLLAAPGFSSWMEGEALDIDRMLHTTGGKPRVSIFSIAHLNDAERMFFVSLLLTQILSWVRTQPGTSSLRALLYMDEIFGYFPPVANPPSKTPLLTLLKQSRAFGLGIVLATQNPVDLDYKGLANAGTWFIGHLQTERDKERLLDGLGGAGNEAWSDRQKIEKILSGLSSRTFLMNNVHDQEPEIFQTRWTLSYLAGPLTRTQIKLLMDTRRAIPGPEAQTPSAAAPTRDPSSGNRPAIPPEVPQVFLPAKETTQIVYRPMLLGCGKIYFADEKMGIASEQEVSYLLDFSGGAVSLSWENAEQTNVKQADLQKSPLSNATYEDPPAEAKNGKSYPVWNKSFSDWLFKNQKLKLLKSPGLQQISTVQESERDFRVRLQLMAREKRDRMVESLRKKYAARIAALQERLRRAQMSVQRETEQATHQKVQTAISFGATVLGALFGRKRLGTTSLGRATTAMRGVGRSMKESGDIDRANETVEAVQKQLADLEAELQSETDLQASRIDPLNEQLETVEIGPKRSNISVSLVALAWVPSYL